MHWIERLFALRQDEIAKALPFMGLLVFFFCGVTVARSIATSLMIEDFGKDALPLMFALIGVAQLLFTLLYAGLSLRFSPVRLYVGLLVAMGLFCLACFGLLLLDLRLASALLYVGILVFLPVVVLHDGTHLAAYLNPFEQKKLAGFIAAGIPLGAMLGGGLLFLLLALLPPVWLLPLLPLTVLLTLGMVIWIARRRAHAVVADTAAVRASPLTQMAEGAKVATGVPLLKWLAASLFISTLLQQLLIYFYQGVIYPTEFPDPAERAAFFGKYELILNALALVFQLLLASRLIQRLGVGRSGLVHPLLYLMSSLSLLVSQGLWAGVFAQAVNQELRSYFRKPVENLQFNGIASRLWGVAKSLMGGLIQPLAILLSTLVLVLMQYGLAEVVMQQALKGLLLVMALVGVLLAFPQARAYDQGVLDLLKKRGLPRDRIKELPPELVLNQAREYLRSIEPGQVLLGLELLQQLNRAEAIPDVVRLLQAGPSPAIAEACLQYLGCFPEEGPAFQALWLFFQRQRESLLQPGLVDKALIGLMAFDRPEVVPPVVELMTHAALTPVLLGRAVVYLGRSQHFEDSALLEQRALTILDGPDVALKPQALEILAELGQAGIRSRLTGFLAHEDGLVRAAALHGLSRLPEEPDAAFLQACERALQDRLAPVRLEGVNAIRRLQSPPLPLLDALLPLLDDPAPRIVERVRGCLVEQLAQVAELLETRLFHFTTPFAQRQVLLDLLEPRVDAAFRMRLDKAAQAALGWALQCEGMKRRLPSGVPAEDLRDFLEKALQELQREQLQWVLWVVVYLSGRKPAFFQQISPGLLAFGKREQGLALEALSRLQHRQLAGGLSRVLETLSLPVKRLAALHRELLGKPMTSLPALWQDLERLELLHLRAAAWVLSQRGEPMEPALRALLI